MPFVRSLVVWIVICTATILFGVPAIPLALLPPRGAWFRLLARGWSRIILAASGVRVRVLHGDRLASGRSLVIAPNHESFYDIPVLFSVLPMPVRFLAKRNLFRLPILGWSMAAAGFVPVDRADRSRSFATVEAALDGLQNGSSLIVFPEETRTLTGELLPFKSGAAMLALKAGLPLLPLGIAGTFRIQRRGGFTIARSHVTVAVGEPIEAAAQPAQDRTALTGALRESVARLREEAAADIESRREEPWAPRRN